MSQSTPVIWTIAGFDPSSGGGVQADLKSATALGVHSCCILTSLTAQNSTTVMTAQPISENLLQAQIDCLKEECSPQAIKLGLLGDVKSVQVIARTLSQLKVFTVCDPVLMSSSGFPLIGQETLDLAKKLLFDKIHLLTPNLLEAQYLVGYALQSPDDIEKAAKNLVSLGVKSVLIKGGHYQGEFCQDYFFDGTHGRWLSSPRKVGINARGTGCTLASSIAALYALGFDSLDAITMAKSYLNQCMRLAVPMGAKMTTLKYKPWAIQTEDLPWITPASAQGQSRSVFPRIAEDETLGFYPIVDSVSWMERLLPLGIKTIQLRTKNLTGYALEREIRQAVMMARDHHCKLFINEYWDLALQSGAYGVHLGQEDLGQADLTLLSQEKIKLGVSTHCFSEVARAHALRPSYLAVGPIFHTTLKKMKFDPQGIASIRFWKKILPYPLVAIGGMTLEKANEVAGAGADGIAVVSDVLQNAHPEERAQQWLRFFEQQLAPLL